MSRLDVDVLDLPAAPRALTDGTPADPTGPACQAALLSFKTSLGTRMAFTGLVFLVGLAVAGTLVYAVIKIAKDGADLSAVVAGVSGLVASGAAVFLVKRMNEATAAERKALDKVKDFCGPDVASRLK